MQGGTGVLPPMAARWSKINKIIVSGEATLSAENIRKTLAQSGLRPEPCCGSSQLPRAPSWCEGGCCPLPKNPTNALGLRLFGLGPQ